MTAEPVAERQALRRTLRQLLTRHCPPDSVRAAAETPEGFDRRLWDRLCREIGVAGLAVPGAYGGDGGAGAGWSELAIVLEELGAALAPSPMLGTVLAVQALLHGADEAARDRLLPGLADGSRIAGLAWTGPAGRWDPADVACRASGDGAQPRLDGEAHYVLDGGVADVLLVAARGPDGIALYEVDPPDPGVTRVTPVPMDPTRRLSVIRLERARGRRLAAACLLAPVRDAACLALAAEQVGAASRALQLTVEHARTRVQFGRPIGSFQAPAHRLADLHVELAAARSAVRTAAGALDAGSGRADLLAALLKVRCTQVFARVAAEMIQLHGGLGITWEHVSHLYFKRAHGSGELFGPARHHLDRLAAAVLDTPEPPAAW